MLAGTAPSLVQRAVDAVNAHIVENRLHVGDTLPGEGHFAGALGVSRAVMREAFGALAALKMIDVGNGRRPRVAAIDGSVMAAAISHGVTTDQISIAEVWDVRRTLEGRTTALAAVRRSEAQAETIVTLAEAMAAETDRLPEITRHDIAFHQTIAEASGNALFVQIVRSFAPLMKVAVPAAWETRIAVEQRDLVIARHRAIARAIAERDSAAAAAAMHAHFDESIGAILLNAERATDC